MVPFIHPVRYFLEDLETHWIVFSRKDSLEAQPDPKDGQLLTLELQDSPRSGMDMDWIGLEGESPGFP
jgi:hypothetical protein